MQRVRPAFGLRKAPPVLCALDRDQVCRPVSPEELVPLPVPGGEVPAFLCHCHTFQIV